MLRRETSSKRPISTVLPNRASCSPGATAASTAARRASLLMGVHDSHSKSYSETPGGLVITAEKQGWSNEEFEQKGRPEGRHQAHPAGSIPPGNAEKGRLRDSPVRKTGLGLTTWHGELQRHGWDHYVGYMDHVRAHGYYPSFLWKTENACRWRKHARRCGKNSGKLLPRALRKNAAATGRAKSPTPRTSCCGNPQIMEENRKKPMFIFFSTNLPHGPVDILPRKTSMPGTRKYARPTPTPPAATRNAARRRRNTPPWWTSWTGRWGLSSPRCTSWAWRNTP